MTLLIGHQAATFTALLGDSMGFGSMVRVSDLGVQRVEDPGARGAERGTPKLRWAGHRRIVYGVSGMEPDVPSGYLPPDNVVDAAKRIHARCCPYNKWDWGEGWHAYLHVIAAGGLVGSAPQLVRIITWADETTTTVAQPGDFLYGGSAREIALELGLEDVHMTLDVEAAISTLIGFASLLINREHALAAASNAIPLIDWPLRVAVITPDDAFKRDFEGAHQHLGLNQ